MNKRMLLLAVLLTTAVAVHSHEFAPKYLIISFASAIILIIISQRYLFVIKDMGNHVAGQARTNKISLPAMWGKMFTKVILYIFIPAITLTGLFVLVGYLVSK